MRYHIGKSSNGQPEKCVEEATRTLKDPKLIIYVSPVKGFEEYTRLINEKYPKSICIGVTTIVSITKEGYSKKELLVTGIEDGIDCYADVLEEANRYPIKYAERVQKCVQKIRTKKDTLCLEVTSAFRCAEESVLSTLNSVLEPYEIPIFGGTAGNDLTNETTYVALNGSIYENACVFVLVHNQSGAIHLYRENIYKAVTGKTVTATKVDYIHRTVKEYDHKPALKVYAQELGVEETRATDYFDTNPMGRIVGEDMFITANCALLPDKSITYHARIYENSQLVLLEQDDYKSVSRKTIEKIKREVPRPSFAIMCHCLARTLLYEGNGYLQQYAKEMGSAVGDFIGFSGYGEQMNHHQFNQTMIIAVFE